MSSYTNEKNEKQKIKQLFGSFPKITQKTKYAKRQPISEQQVKEQYNSYKILMKSLTNSIYHYTQISNGYFAIRNHIKILSNEISTINQEYFGINSQDYQKKDTEVKMLNQKNNEVVFDAISRAHDKIGQVYSESATAMNNFLEIYSGTIKRKYSKFLEESENLIHYKQKVSNLKQSRELNKVQRNKNKLTSALQQYNQTSQNISVNLTQISAEGTKILFDNYINSLVSVLNLYNGVKNQIVNSQVLNYQKSTQLVNCDDDDELSLTSNHEKYPEHMQKYLYMGDYKSRLTIKKESITKYFNAINNQKFKQVNNLFESFDDIHIKKPENLTYNTQKQYKKSHFSAFQNLLHHNHHQLNEVKQALKINPSIEMSPSHYPKSAAIKIKSINHLDPSQLRSKNQYSSNNSRSRDLKKKGQNSSGQTRPIRQLQQKLVKVPRQEDIDLLDLNF